MTTPIFDKKLFWDVNYATINWENSYKWVIERVFERGDVEDIRNCRRHYGDFKIKEALISSKWLPLPTICLAAAILDCKLTDFSCYETSQSNPEHWIY